MRFSASGASVEAASSRGSARRSPGSSASSMPAPSRQRGQFVDAVAPVVDAAEQAHHDQLRAPSTRARNRDRPNRDAAAPRDWRAAASASAPRARHRRAASAARSLSVNDRHDHVGRRLAEIDRFGRFVEGACFDPRDMHGRRFTPPARRRWRCGRGPSRRSRRAGSRRASPGAHGAVEIAAEALADALHQQAHRLARRLRRSP